MSVYVFDIDGTLVTQDGSNYHTAKPLKEPIAKLNKLYEEGHTIILMTARGQSSGIDHTEFTKKQMRDFGIKHHSLIMNKKPAADFYIDDKALNVFDWLRGKEDLNATLKYPISEAVDRYTICKLKHERIDGEDLSEQLAVLKNEIEKYPGIDSFVDRLYKINGECWDMESDIRKGKEGKLGLEEVGRRTLTLRDKNKIRVGIKNEIVKKYGEGFEDIKMNHASQD